MVLIICVLLQTHLLLESTIKKNKALLTVCKKKSREVKTLKQAKKRYLEKIQFLTKLVGELKSKQFINEKH